MCPLPHLVRDEDGGLASKQALDAVVKDVVGSVVVHSRQGVVQQHQVAVGVGAAGKVDALALATRQVHTANAGTGLVAVLRGQVAGWEGSG